MSAAVLLVGDSYSDSTLFYKTHFLAGDPFVYIERNGQHTLVVSSMERGRARKESIVSDVRAFDDFGYKELLANTNDRKSAFVQVVNRIVDDTGAKQVSVGAGFPALYADSLRAGGLAIKIDPDLYIRPRRQKSDDEIAAIEEVQVATEKAVDHVIRLIQSSQASKSGVLQLNAVPLTAEYLRTEIEVALLRFGMDSTHSPIVAPGPGAADPHWEGHGEIREGQSIVIDVFPRSKRTRYFADMTRTVARGNPGDTMRSMYDAVRQALEAGLREVRAGANGRAVHQAVEATFKERGFHGEGDGPRFTHGTGHGVGLDIHEAPSLGSLDTELLENEVVTIEPGLYDPAIGAVRIEDLVVVTKRGYRNLTQFPKQFEL